LKRLNLPIKNILGETERKEKIHYDKVN